MSTSKRLRQLADRTGLDGFADELRAMADEMDAAAPVQDVQEPVAWRHPENAACVTTDPTAYARGIPLYTAPKPEPAPLYYYHMVRLIDSAIQGHAGTRAGTRDAMRWLVRAVESHHGIKG